MKEMIKMVVVLTVLSALSGGLLAALRDGTKDKIEMQELNLVKGPTIRSILSGASNDPLTDRFNIKDGETERSIFVGVFDGKPNTVAFEVSGKSFGGDIGMMVAVNVTDDKLVGVGVTTSQDTPGLGLRAKTDPSFAAQFKGHSIDKTLKVTQDGGDINALSGATITSRGVCATATDAETIYRRIKPQLMAKLKDFSK